MNTTQETRIALITGASRGLGQALARQLNQEGWTLLLTARSEDDLTETARELGAHHIAGDISNPQHRQRLADAAAALGGLDLLVNNASTLGPTPLPLLTEVDLNQFGPLYDTNVIAPLGLIQSTIDLLRQRHGAVITISSDAATEPYEEWGPYGSSKAALDQIANVLGAEEPDLRVWAIEPSDMNTVMLHDALGIKEASGANPPERPAKAISNLIAQRPPSGRVSALDFESVPLEVRTS